MLKIYTFGPAFGLPDPSTFVMKALVLMKMSSLHFETDTSGFSKAPKGKLPYINDNGTIIADSTFIRTYIEKKLNFDFDSDLTESDKAVSWAFEKMCEDHLYWAIMDCRWMINSNFDKGPRFFFQAAPALIRPLIIRKVRSDVKRTLNGQGMGRHSRSEIEELAKRDIDAIATFLGDKPWFMGNNPCGADATIFAFVAGALCNHFDGPILANAKKHANLVNYVNRCMAQWFPEFSQANV